MKGKNYFAFLLCGAVLCSAMTGCSSERDPNAPDDVASETTETTETTETSAAETTETSAQTTTTAETTTVTETTAGTDETGEAETTASAYATNPRQTDNDTKILWSERGLEVVPIDSEDGYGSLLEVGAEYAGWTLYSFDGILAGIGEDVAEVYADFTYANGALAQNGQIRVLPSDDPHYPNGLYMHVDNLADFPYFPVDTRDRGWFVIENAKDVLSMLDLNSAADISGDLSVSVSIDTLHIHVAKSDNDDYDTIHVTAASKR